MRRNDAWLWYLLGSSNDSTPSPHHRRNTSSQHHSTPGRLVGRLTLYAVLIACAIELLRNR